MPLMPRIPPMHYNPALQQSLGVQLKTRPALLELIQLIWTSYPSRKATIAYDIQKYRSTHTDPSFALTHPTNPLSNALSAPCFMQNDSLYALHHFETPKI